MGVKKTFKFGPGTQDGKKKKKRKTVGFEDGRGQEPQRPSNMNVFILDLHIVIYYVLHHCVLNAMNLFVTLLVTAGL